MSQTGAMTPRTAHRPFRSWGRLGRWMAGLLLASPLATAAPPSPVATIYQDTRSFKIPFKVSDETRKRIADVHLYVSADGGLSWDPAGTSTPDSPAFAFRARGDGEYWFAVRTRDHENRLYPPGDEAVQPALKVIVDTAKPSIVVNPLPRRGSQVGIRWEVQDEHIDLSTLVVEYQQDQGAPADSWRSVQITPRPAGQVPWDAGTGLPLRVRVSVADKAGNRQEVERLLPDGLAGTPLVQNAGQLGNAGPPPIQAIPYQPPGEPEAGGLSPDPFEHLDPSPPPRYAPEPSPADASPSQPATRPAPSAPVTGPGGALLVGSNRFPIQYEVYEGGEESVGTVEMWISRDHGASWEMLGTDPDRRSPFPVEVGGDGQYGLYLVLLSEQGVGDPRPEPGSEPQILVEVDTTPPQVRLDPPRRGSGDAAGALIITWQASDPHLDARPVVLQMRPEQPGAIWQQITREPIANSGQYVWPLPSNLPPRFSLRIDVFDSLGNRSAAETQDPVSINVARPRGRILGLDPSARSNTGPVR